MRSNVPFVFDFDSLFVLVNPTYFKLVESALYKYLDDWHRYSLLGDSGPSNYYEQLISAVSSAGPKFMSKPHS